MLVGMKRTDTGHGLEEKGGETGDREVGLEEQEKGEGFLAPDKGEIRTEEGKEICAGAMLMATHAYTRNTESPLGKKIDLQQWETLIFKGEHAENEHWRLVEDRNGQVGYAPAAFPVVILDTTAEEEESGATKKGQEDSTEENRIGGWIGQEGERRNSYSAAVIDGIKRNSRIYVGDSIVRKTDTRLSRGEDVVVCLPGARIEHVTERVEQIMGRGYGGTILVHVGTNHTDKNRACDGRVEQIMGRGYGGFILAHVGTNNTDKNRACDGRVEQIMGRGYGGSILVHVGTRDE